MLRDRSFLLACLLLTYSLVALAGQDQAPALDLYGDPLPPGAIARLGTVRFRHDNPIVFAAFLPGGKSVISVSNDGLVCVWEFPSGKPLRRFEAQPADEGKAGAAAKVTRASLSPDGKHLSAFCSDGFLRIWDWANAKQAGKVATPVSGNPLYDYDYDYYDFGGMGPGGAVFASPVYSPDGKALLLPASTRVLQLVEFPTGKEIGPSLGHTDRVTALSFTPDGGQLRTQNATKSTHTWDSATSKDLGAITPKLPSTPGYPTVISPDGRVGVAVSRLPIRPALLAVPPKAREAVLFDTVSGKELGTIELEVGITPLYRKPVQFSPDGKMLAVVAGDAQQRIDLYEVSSRKLLRLLEAGPAALPANVGPGGVALRGRGAAANQSLLFSGRGRTLAFQAGPGAATVVLNTATGKQIAELPAIEGSPALQGAFSPNERCLALERGDGTLMLYELATGQPRGTYGSKPPASPAAKDDPLAAFGLGVGPFGVGPAAPLKPRASVAISPDGQLLALSGPGGTVHVWDVWTGKELTVFKGHTLAVKALAFDPKGKTLASASDDTTALLWDLSQVPRPARPAKVPQPGDLEAWWQALADGDATKAFAAMGAWAAVPKEAVDWIKDRVKPAPPLDRQRALSLMKQLDDDQFEVREQAKRDLLKLGEPLLPVLDQALVGNLSPESERRLKELHGKLTEMGLQSDRLRVVRAVEVLERIGTPQARQVLQALAGGAPGALATTSAEAALKR
jgi:WD40 repeat protein